MNLSNIDIQLFDNNGILLVLISGVSLDQIKANPELKKTAEATVDRLIAQNKALGWEVKPPAAMSFDEIDRALRAFTSRTRQEIINAIKACPVSYPQFSKNQRQQILFHLSVQASVFETDRPTYEAAKVSYNAVLDWENDNADHE